MLPADGNIRLTVTRFQTSDTDAADNGTVTHLLSGYGLFWVFVLILNTGPSREQYSGPVELVVTAGITTALQMLMALVTIRLMAPHFLLDNKTTLFFSLLFLTAILIAEVLIVCRLYNLEPVYSETYQRFIETIGPRDIWQRTPSPWAFK